MGVIQKFSTRYLFSIPYITHIIYFTRYRISLHISPQIEEEICVSFYYLSEELITSQTERCNSHYLGSFVFLYMLNEESQKKIDIGYNLYVVFTIIV